MRKIPRLGLTAILVLFCLSAAAVTWGTSWPLILQVSQGATERQNSFVLRGRGQLASTQLTRTIYEDWFKLQRLATYITRDEAIPVLRTRLDTVQTGDAEIAWIGFADTSGTVVVANGGVLEGENVAQRPWFRAGIDRPFAGDRHESLLLARFLTARSKEPIRLIDLSLPVRRSDGSLMGVLGMHVDWLWVRNFVLSFAREDVDVILISREGEVLAGPSDVEGHSLTVPSVRAVRQGAGVTNTERWPDGKDYLVSVVPVTSYQDLPSFGWSVIVRQRADDAFGPARNVIRQAMPVMLGLGAMLVLLSLLLGRMLGQPVVRLSRAATEMVEHRFHSPIPDERRYREVALLASALARLQSAADRGSNSDTSKSHPGEHAA
jgi:HAMP domain-containing protein